jgi:hypothetical protein
MPSKAPKTSKTTKTENKRKRIVISEPEPEDDVELTQTETQTDLQADILAHETQTQTTQTKAKKSKTVAQEKEQETKQETEEEIVDINQVKHTIGEKINEIRQVMTSESFENDMQRGLEKCQITALRRLRSKLERIKKEAHCTKKLILNVMKLKKTQLK